MNTTEDLTPVITVDWVAVEDDLDCEIDDDLRGIIEHEGSTTSVALDRWGRADDSTVELSAAVREHGRITHPERGALDSRYAPLDTMSSVVNVLRILRGEDRNSGTIIDKGDDEEYIEGVADLYDAARALDERRDDWREDHYPSIRMGSYGPDQLGNLYVDVGHDEQSVIESIDVEGLPAEVESISARGQRSYSNTEEHYAAVLRHERYYLDDPEPTVADERADEIGYLGSNGGKRTLESEFDERGFEYEELGTLELGALDPTATLYEYQKEGETRYGVEWTERPVIDDYVIRSLIFDERPDSEDVATVLTIEDHRRENRGWEER
jgi:hypothetical protein